MKTFEIEVQGVTQMLQHKMPDEELFALLGAKSEKKKAKEELTPREIAEKHVYKTIDGKFYIPTEQFSKAFAYVAGDYKQKNSARKSIKSVAGGIFRPTTDAAIICDDNWKPVKGFEVDLKKGNNHQKGAICICRPRFDKWKAKFSVAVDDSIVATNVVLEILNDAGKRAGIGSFRVNRGGYFGQFSVIKFKEV
jgi:hypothetical protein